MMVVGESIDVGLRMGFLSGMVFSVLLVTNSRGQSAIDYTTKLSSMLEKRLCDNFSRHSFWGCETGVYCCDLCI